MLEVRNLKKTYGKRTVLDIESLSLVKGETAVIIGPNGSGKSTFLKILASVTDCTQGEISFDGKILYLPQTSVAFNMSVMKNLMYCMEKPDEKKCEDVLSRLGLFHLKDKNAKSLSGGECQKLALGRILVKSCDLLLLDEPTSAVDIEGAQIITDALNEYKKQTGCTILMSTHSPAQAKSCADRVIMLYEGRVAETGDGKQVLENPASEWGKKFIAEWKI